MNMNAGSTCENLVATFAAGVAANPAQVRVLSTMGVQSTVIEVTTAPSDHGRILGKEGKHVKALEYLVRLVGGGAMRISAVPWEDASDVLLAQPAPGKRTTEDLVKLIAQALGGQLFWHVMTPERTKAVVVLDKQPEWTVPEAEFLIQTLIFAVSCADGIRCRFRLQVSEQPEVADGRYAKA